MRMDCRMLKIVKVAKLRVAGCVFGEGLSRPMLHARCNTERSGDGGQDGDGDVDDFLPDFLFVHGS